jgi:hypothetical protein
MQKVVGSSPISRSSDFRSATRNREVRGPRLLLHRGPFRRLLDTHETNLPPGAARQESERVVEIASEQRRKQVVELAGGDIEDPLVDAHRELRVGVAQETHGAARRPRDTAMALLDGSCRLYERADVETIRASERSAAALARHTGCPTF